ncbi:hypothetical protein Musp01_22500 [Muricauda sp. NBRC 101325]|nr:hypothetical protein Musp01_22500 [Muricauda sp. NBRC 101325]
MILVISCTVKEESENPNPDIPKSLLSQEQLDFIEAYHYITYNLSPTSFGSSANERWEDSIRIYIHGSTFYPYNGDFQGRIDEFNQLMTNGSGVILVNSLVEANVQLFYGNREDLESIWPDMFNLTTSSQKGYATYTTNSKSEITSGRIWVKYSELGLFTHEFGHVLGLGHADSGLCGETIEASMSMMCSNAPNNFYELDKNIIKALYTPRIPVGKTFEAVRPVLEEMLLDGTIQP